MDVLSHWVAFITLWVALNHTVAGTSHTVGGSHLLCGYFQRADASTSHR